MDRVLEGWRRRVVDPRLPRTLARHLREAGFSIARARRSRSSTPAGTLAPTARTRSSTSGQAQPASPPQRSRHGQLTYATWRGPATTSSASTATYSSPLGAGR
jgi:hypothetical protein